MTDPSGDRCTGHCCEDVGLSLSPAQLRDGYMAFIRPPEFREAERPSMHAQDGRGRMSQVEGIYQDIALIYPMLTYSHQDYQHEDRDKDAPADPNRPAVYHYSCKHFDRRARACTIYDIRPKMCSSFASCERGCGYAKCTWTEATERRRVLLERRRAEEANATLRNNARDLEVGERAERMS